MNSNKPSNNAFSHRFREFCETAGPSSRFRLAPTPSGFLHRGNALNFLLNEKAARIGGGKLLLRIDDIDAERKRPEFLTDIFESLEWLGIRWDEGPGLIDGDTRSKIDDFEQNWSQHRRLGLAQNLLQQLREKDLLFACNKSRKELQQQGRGYPARFRDQGLTLDTPQVAWRIKTSGLPEEIQDFVVRRRDGLPAYQIASLADDLHFGITHIIRGADLEASTLAQQFIARQLNAKAFLDIQFLHHPLILDEKGEKMSKSAGAESLKQLREQGASSTSLRDWAEGMLTTS